MSKFLMLGMPLAQMIARATVNAARVFPTFDTAARSTLARRSLGIAPCSVELCGASAAVIDVKRPSPFGQRRGGLFPFRSAQQGRLVRPEVA
jgi:hypothetical protein